MSGGALGDRTLLVGSSRTRLKTLVRGYSNHLIQNLNFDDSPYPGRGS